jgi:hypothetical protein
MRFTNWQTIYNNAKQICSYCKEDRLCNIAYNDGIYIYAISKNLYKVKFWDHLESYNDYFIQHLKSLNIKYKTLEGGTNFFYAYFDFNIRKVKSIVNQFLVKMEKLNAFS